MSAKKKIELELEASTVDLLAVLSDDGDVRQLIYALVDHARQGVYRPGAWERGWLEQAFGDEWTDKLEPGDPYGRPNCEHIFQKPRKPTVNTRTKRTDYGRK